MRLPRRQLDYGLHCVRKQFLSSGYTLLRSLKVVPPLRIPVAHAFRLPFEWVDEICDCCRPLMVQEAAVPLPPKPEAPAWRAVCQPACRLGRFAPCQRHFRVHRVRRVIPKVLVVHPTITVENSARLLTKADPLGRNGRKLGRNRPEHPSVIELLRKEKSA